ncbi:MAG: hypothetical protein AAF570_28720 [Bacteroidota bacterium]
MKPNSFYDISGTLHKALPEHLAQALRDALGPVEAKEQFVGMTLVHEADNARLATSTSYEDGSLWTLNADFEGQPADFEAWFGGIIAQLDGADLAYCLDYAEVDEVGNDLSEEVTVEHSEFEARTP